LFFPKDLDEVGMLDVFLGVEIELDSVEDVGKFLLFSKPEKLPFWKADMGEGNRGIDLVFIPAPRENSRSPEYQQELFDLALSFTHANVNYRARGEVRESFGAGNFFDGQFWIELLQQTISQSIATTIGVLVGVWLAKKPGRRISVERHGVKLEFDSVDDAVRAIEQLEQREKEVRGQKVTIHDR
jgi:hypothetical protein